MRLIKLGAVSVFFLALVVFLMSLLIPSKVRISRAVNILAPKDSILAHLENPAKWSSWNEMVHEGTEISILSLSGDSVLTSWKTGKEPVVSGFALEESGGTTVVQWYFDFRLKWYPWEKFGSIVFDKHFGTPMEQSLNKLKKLVENSP